jgi:hypothetical protein
MGQPLGACETMHVLLYHLAAAPFVHMAPEHHFCQVTRYLIRLLLVPFQFGLLLVEGVLVGS